MEFEIDILDCVFEVRTTCCNKPAKRWVFPYGVSAMEIARKTGMPLSLAVKIAEENKEAPSCGELYESDEIAETIRKDDCVSGKGTYVQVVIPAGMFKAKTKKDADKQARDYFERHKQMIANSQGDCIEDDCLSCPPYRVIAYTACGEQRVDQQCVNGKCVDVSQPYFVCTGDCEGETCMDASCPDLCICYEYRVVRVEEKGEWRVDAACRNHRCVETSQPYFVCYDC